MNEWYPIETAPKDGGTFIIACFAKYRNPVAYGHWQYALAHWRLDGKSVPRWMVTNMGKFEHATHWMPFPPPPKPLASRA